MELLRLEELRIRTPSVFGGHGYLQHGECHWSRCYSVRLQTFLTTATHHVKNTVEFAYGAIFPVHKSVRAPLKNSGKAVCRCKK